MRTHVAFLRGINVGGRSILPMKRLAEIAKSQQLESVRTHVQSGNLVFDANGRDEVVVGTRLEEAIEAEFGFRPVVILRSRTDLQSAIKSNPFAGPGVDPSRLMTIFLQAAPNGAAVARLEPERFPEVRFSVVGRELHVIYEDGMGR